MNLEISLEDVAKQLNNKDENSLTLQGVLDDLYGIGICATNIVGLLTGSFTVPDLFKNFKPSTALKVIIPEKYINVTKEENAINRYNKLTVCNLSIIVISFNQALKSQEEEIKKIIDLVKKDKNSIDILENEFLNNDKKIFKFKCELPKISNNNNIIDYIEVMLSNFKVLSNFINKQEENKLYIFLNLLKEKTLQNYYINLLEIIDEFPEVKLWIDLESISQNQKTTEEIKRILKNIENFKIDSFINEFGFNQIDKLINDNLSKHLNDLKKLIDEDTIKNVSKHHNFIRQIVKEPLISEQDIIENLKLPIREEIYISQSFKCFSYNKKEHNKYYLDENNWNNIPHNSYEDIGKMLFQALKDPHNINHPIIILGHPGAGKSMLSSQFAYKLLDNDEFIPFYIKLRDIDSSNANVNSHINEGLSKTIFCKTNINWIDLVEKFSDKTAVIILDGFDELLRATQTELNDYILRIQEVQKSAISSNINIRIILTSRLTIMQDVIIPNESLILKLDSFDEKRKNLWISKWNEIQRHKEFILPNREDLNELSKEPLLLFLLALYDFKDNELSKMVNENLNKSSLYDKLFEGFTLRQLNKDLDYRKKTVKDKKFEELLFRLRIGFFAVMLFIHDEVHHYEKKFDDELEAFELNTERINAKKILDGFFFIHKDKSVNGHNNENLSFEFLHKTFGEFLAADFMLRILKFKVLNDYELHLNDTKYFRQVFGLQWIIKQQKILDFIFEHSKNIIDLGDLTKLKIFIKDELKNIVDENTLAILPLNINNVKVIEKLKHLAIYSQNLFLLWIILEKEEKFVFELSPKINSKNTWRTFVDLWKNYLGFENLTIIKKFIKIIEEDNKVIIIKEQNAKSKVFDFTNYANLTNNSYKIILSYFNENDISLDNLLSLQKNEIEKELLANLIIYKIEYFFKQNQNHFNLEMFLFLFKYLNFKNKIVLSNFYFDNGLKYKKINFAKFLHNCLTGGHLDIKAFEKKEIAIYQKLNNDERILAIEHFLKIENDRSPAGTMFTFLLQSKDLEKISCSNKIKIVEIYLEIKSHDALNLSIMNGKKEKTTNYEKNIKELITTIQLEEMNYLSKITKLKIYLLLVMFNIRIEEIKKIILEEMKKEKDNNSDDLDGDLDGDLENSILIIKISLELNIASNDIKYFFNKIYKNSERRRNIYTMNKNYRRELIRICEILNLDKIKKDLIQHSEKQKDYIDKIFLNI